MQKVLSEFLFAQTTPERDLSCVSGARYGREVDFGVLEIGRAEQIRMWRHANDL